MASEDSPHGSSPDTGRQREEDHNALVLAEVMRQLEDGFSKVLTEGAKKEENEVIATILNERSEDCKGEKIEAESGVSMAGSEGIKNEAALIDDENEDSLHRRILHSIVNWHGCEEEKFERFKKEEMEGREIQNEINGEKVENQSGRIVIDDYSVERGTGSVREEEKGDNENDEDSLQWVILDSIVNRHWFQAEKVGNENENVRCNVSELNVENVEDQSRRIAVDDCSVESGTRSVPEEEKVDNENKVEEDEDSLHRRILLSIVNWHGCEGKRKVENEDDEEVQRRILHSLVNWFLCEEEKVGNIENENEVSLAKTEMEGREIQSETDVENVAEDASRLNQIDKELDEIESALKNENDIASDLEMISTARVLDTLSGTVETEEQLEDKVKERINCCCCS